MASAAGQEGPRVALEENIAHASQAHTALSNARSVSVSQSHSAEGEGQHGSEAAGSREAHRSPVSVYLSIAPRFHQPRQLLVAGESCYGYDCAYTHCHALSV